MFRSTERLTLLETNRSVYGTVGNLAASAPNCSVASLASALSTTGQKFIPGNSKEQWAIQVRRECDKRASFADSWERAGTF